MVECIALHTHPYLELADVFVNFSSHYLVNAKNLLAAVECTHQQETGVRHAIQ